MASPSELAGDLREKGLRATAPRVAILDHLRNDFSHPTPEEIHAALRQRHPTLSLSTVYQTLEAFLRAGLCRRVAIQDGRLRVDGDIREHDHAICRHCGSIFDLGRTDSIRPAKQRELPMGMRLLGIRIEYEVVCPDCSSGSPGPGRG